jgi:hypothetical protein
MRGSGFGAGFYRRSSTGINEPVVAKYIVAGFQLPAELQGYC